MNKEERDVNIYSVESAFVFFITNNKEYHHLTYQKYLDKFAKDKEFRNKVFDYLNERFKLKQ